MTTIDIGEAATQLPQLIERALAGEEIAFARGGLPVAQNTPVRTRTVEPQPRQLDPSMDETSGPPQRRNLAGSLRDDPWLASINLDAPLDEEVARAFGMLDG